MRLPRLRLDWGDPKHMVTPVPPPEESSVLAQGTVRRVDLVAPEGVEIRPDCVRIGPDRWVRTYMVSALPSELYTAFFARVLDVCADLDLSIEIEPVDKGKAEVELTRQIARLAGQMSTGTAARSGLGRDRLEKAHSDYTHLRALLSRDEDALYRLSVAIQVGAGTEEELRERCRLLETEVGIGGVRLRQLFWRQRDGLGAAGPLPNAPELGYQRNANRGACAASIPLAGGRWTDDGGMFIGQDLRTQAPVLWSPFASRLSNYNIVMVGQPGKGKSAACKMIATRLLASGARVAIIDHEGEYTRVFHDLEYDLGDAGRLRYPEARFGALVVRLDPDHPSGINLMDVQAERDEDTQLAEVPINRAVEEVTAWCEMVLGHGAPVSPERSALVSQAAMKCYEDAKITRDPDSLWLPATEGSGAGKTPRRRPQLSDLVERLSTLGADAGMLAALQRYTSTGSRPMFDCQAVPIDSPIIVVDVSAVREDPQLLAVCMTGALRWLWTTLSAIQGPKMILVDEAWQMTRQPQAAAFLSRMARGGRKRFISLAVTTQFIREFIANDASRDILGAAQTRWIGGMSEDEAQIIRSALELSAGQSRLVTQLGAGQFLLRAPGRAAVVHTVPTAEELEWYNTDPRKKPPVEDPD